MRKILIILLILLLCAFCYFSFTKGITVANIDFNSFNKLKDEYQKLDTQIENVNTKSTVDFENKKSALDTAFKELTNLEKSYKEKMQMAMAISEEQIKKVDIYDVDFLWTKLGTYATDDNINMNVDIKENSTGKTINDDYGLYDFYFTISGEYINITNFIYHLEDDEQLEFSIESFKLVPGSGLTATFKVTEVPLNKANLVTNGNSLPTKSTENTNTQENTNAPENTNAQKNTTGDNT